MPLKRNLHAKMDSFIERIGDIAEMTPKWYF